tara:strand:+ start:845 stop:1102 length:258 start_codon:yes stop_codon:yes gene_type:complete
MFSWLKEFFLTNMETVRKDKMIPPFLMTMAANFILDMVKDKATKTVMADVEKALGNAPKELVEALDKAVDEDAGHAHKSLMDLIK